MRMEATGITMAEIIALRRVMQRRRRFGDGGPVSGLDAVALSLGPEFTAESLLSGGESAEASSLSKGIAFARRRGYQKSSRCLGKSPKSRRQSLDARC